MQVLKLWSYIKSRKKDNIGVGSLHCDGLIYTDSLDKANVLNRHFSSVFTTEDTSHLPPLNEHNIPAICMEPLTINPAGVADLLSKIKPFKTSGPGGSRAADSSPSGPQLRWA